MIFPCHPRTKSLIKKFKIKLNKTVKLIEPIRYDHFLNLLYFSYLIISDSGGVQEETCILKKKMITLRTKTERQETLKIGCNILSEINLEEVLKKIKLVKKRKISWKNPYGQGNISEKMSNQILKLL